MKKSGRHQKSSTAQVLEAFAEVAGMGCDVPRAPSVVDPAEAAVGILFDRMREASRLTVPELGQQGIVVLVTVPDMVWADLVLEHWKASVRHKAAYQDGYGRTEFNLIWVAYVAREKPRASNAAEIADAFAARIGRGRHCLGIAPDPSWLPADLVAGADHRLLFPVLTSADMRLVAEQVCGEPVDGTGDFKDGMAAQITPRLLRLARRPAQKSHEYLDRLVRLLEQDRTADSAQATGSPRDMPTLERLHGMDEAVAWGQGLARDLKAYRAGTLTWSDVDRGCLMSGPPGCGKTLLARALAATCGIPLFTGSYGQWIATGGGHLGDFLKAMRQTFTDARAAAPAILFIDEVDSFPNRGTVTQRYAEWDIQVVNTLLAEIDGVDGRDGVVLLAACNHPWRLDPALVRSGRLDRHIRVALPDQAALAAILREHLGPEADGWDLSRAALEALGSSGADCERLAREARRRARIAGRPMVLADLTVDAEGAAEHSPETWWRIAVHEAGHAVLSHVIAPGTLQLLRLGGGGGGMVGAVVMSNAETSGSAADIHRRLTVTLAGRAAEELFLGDPSAGAGGSASSDLAQATSLALATVTAFGLDKEFGPVWLGMPDPGTTPMLLASSPTLMRRVRSALTAAYEDALACLHERRMALLALAKALVEQRVIEGAKAQAIIDLFPADTAREEAPS